MPHQRLTTADFRMLDDDPSLGREESILEVSFVKCFEELNHAKANHVEDSGTHTLLYLKLRNGSQMVFIIRDDPQLYQHCARFDWFPEMAMDYEGFVADLHDNGVEMESPMVVGYVVFEDPEDTELSDRLLDLLDYAIKPKLRWFVPHVQMHASLRGLGFAGVTYSRFLRMGSVGLITATHTPDAAKLWASVAKHTESPLIFAERNGKKFSLSDGPELGRDAVKILVPKSRFAAASKALKLS